MKDVPRNQLKHLFFAVRRTDVKIIKKNKMLEQEINNKSHKSKIKNNQPLIEAGNKAIRKQ
ncbi:hypothetical protein EO92_16975 [Methanosarcina sp. 2.H.A.1B.4]|nr:hypothetical protein EO92_16975 [Methanosarcina sp. 2.H.A.1B.4]